VIASGLASRFIMSPLHSQLNRFQLQILLDRPFCMTAALIRIQAHHALS
jgi:hypothetical protein